jgi:lipid-A-disaccharide synthase
MAAAGCELHEDLTQLAVMWFWRVVLNLHRFWNLLWRADRYFAAERPDAVVLIDYPGFNWWIARRARRHGIPVFYYGAPQMWAWAPWRVRKMRRLVDHVLCKLPFEESWYRQRGCRATYVGHPYFDEMQRQQLDETFLAVERRKPGRLVTILPGSRTQEVVHNLPAFLRAARLIEEQAPGVRFAVASFDERQARLARDLVHTSGVAAEVFVGRTGELAQLAECCLACSGSVSLELLHHGKPAVILYSIGRLAYAVQALFRRVKYITLVNLLAADELNPRDLAPFDPAQPGAEQVPFPEYLTCRDKSRELAAHIVTWLADEPSRQAYIARLEELRLRFGHAGASRRAAEYIVRHLPLSYVARRAA